MPRKPQIVTYAREIHTSTNIPHALKFAKLYTAVRAARQAEGIVLVAFPEVLGDTFEEVMQSLNVIARADVSLRIVPPAERGKPGEKP
jgi:hypothetical protein